jgi:hypothetical protein
MRLTISCSILIDPAITVVPAQAGTQPARG